MLPCDQSPNYDELGLVSSLQTAEAALDIFLTRVHALALPYLTSASTSFLIHLSPQAYYTLHCLSNSTTLASAAGQLPGSASWKLDIPLAALRTRLSQDSRLPGATLATLSLARADNLSSQFFSQQYSQFPDSILATRPTFRLPGTWHLGTLNHMFPVPPEPPETMQEQSINEVSDREAQDVDGRQVWMLDFTDGGRTPGIVISHTRMREIFCVIAPADPLEGTLGLDMHYPPFHGSWISLLVSRLLALHVQGRLVNIFLRGISSNQTYHRQNAILPSTYVFSEPFCSICLNHGIFRDLQQMRTHLFDYVYKRRMKQASY